MMDEFLAKLSGKLSGLVVGDPLDERTDMGSLINRKQFDRVCGYIEDGLQQPGVRVVMGGLPEHRDGKHGYFVKPTVFANVDNEWRIAREEIFGPVLCVIPWTEVEDAIRMANQSHYGLAAFVWSHDISRALNAAHSIEAGWVQVNQGIGQILGQSYGGVKESGVGREMSLEGMLEGFTQRRSVTVNLAF
jgi:betaine-aldehyde dehydrogenase